MGDRCILGAYYFDLYPNEKYYDYKKFMKYTYKISNDSAIKIAIKKDINFGSDGKYLHIYIVSPKYLC